MVRQTTNQKPLGGEERIERCDDCINILPPNLRMFDPDLALLPEAVAAFQEHLEQLAAEASGP